MYHRRTLACLDKAKELLKSDDEDAFIYASLQLRMAIEHWFYDLRKLYLKWIPEAVIRKWQPHQIIKAILEVDPDALTDETIAFHDPGQPDTAIPFQTRNLSKSVIKKKHNSLGKFLHARMNGRSFDREKWLDELEKTIAAIEPLRDATVMSSFRSWEVCECDCGIEIYRTREALKPNTIVKCPITECQREYVVDELDAQLAFTPISMVIVCPGCEKRFSVNRGFIQPNAVVECPDCETGFELLNSYRLEETKKSKNRIIGQPIDAAEPN